MKKSILTIFSSLLILSGCGTQNLISPSNSNVENYLAYDNTLTIEGITPLSQYGGVLDNGYLVIRKTFEDYTDVIFFAPGLREKHFENSDDYLPGNTVSFKGRVEASDGAAGTHYYEGEIIDELTTTGYPTEEEVKEILEGYRSCDIDEDCSNFYPGCPLGCALPVNTDYLDIATQIAENFRNKQDPQCAYRCLTPSNVVCEEHTCRAKFDAVMDLDNNTDLTDSEIDEANSLFN